jgi:hypothetical protein
MAGNRDSVTDVGDGAGRFRTALIVVAKWGW